MTHVVRQKLACECPERCGRFVRVPSRSVLAIIRSGRRLIVAGCTFPQRAFVQRRGYRLYKAQGGT